MSTVAIRAEVLSKEYRIGAKQEGYQTLRETVSDTLVAPFRRARKLLRGQATGAAELDEAIWALKDVSLEINRGEVVGIIGRNGAGKTTLLKILSRITEPTKGCAEIFGRVGTLLEVGTGFHPELTGRENIYLNGAILGMKKAEMERKFDEIVAFAEVKKFIDTPVKHYSTGMSVRLAFAVAAHLESETLLVDEVLAVGDSGFQKKCMSVMNNLGESGKTVLLVSHNMAAIENLCSRAIWIDNGEIRRDGGVKEVINAYLSTFAEGQQSGLDLGMIQSRSGSGLIHYTGIEFLSSDGQPQNLVRTGSSLTVRLHYQAKERIPYPIFGMEIYTNLGTLLTLASTWCTSLDIPFACPGHGYIDLEIDSLYLMPGRYYISLRLQSYGPVDHDRLDRCTTLEVEGSDFYGSGKGMHSSFGIICLPYKWKMPDAGRETDVRKSSGEGESREDRLPPQP